jgi:hypothetical protein
MIAKRDGRTSLHTLAAISRLSKKSAKAKSVRMAVPALVTSCPKGRSRNGSVVMADRVVVVARPAELRRLAGCSNFQVLK